MGEEKWLVVAHQHGERWYLHVRGPAWTASRSEREGLRMTRAEAERVAAEQRTWRDLRVELPRDEEVADAYARGLAEGL